MKAGYERRVTSSRRAATTADLPRTCWLRANMCHGSKGPSASRQQSRPQHEQPGLDEEAACTRHGPHGVETPTPGTPLLAGVREASGPHLSGERRFSVIFNHDPVELSLIVKKLCNQHGSPSTIFAWRSQIYLEVYEV